jgi:hypothetical protein
MLTRTRSDSFEVKGAVTRAVQFTGRSTGQGDNNALIASVPRVEVGLLAEHEHPADGSVQDVIDKAPRSYSRCSWHEHICYQKRAERSSWPCKAGSAAARIHLVPDFDEPLEDFKEYMK